MRVALADVEPEALQRAFTELNDDGATVIAVPTDVSNADAVEQLAACELSALMPTSIFAEANADDARVELAAIAGPGSPPWGDYHPSTSCPHRG